MIKTSVPTFGKTDAIKFRPSDLIPFLPAFTGRKQRTEEQIDAMVESLLNEGQIQPIVYRIGFGRNPIIIAGTTRVLAADRINSQGLTDSKGNTYSQENPFVLSAVCKNVNDLEALILTFMENSGDTRTPVNELDEAEFVRILGENYGLSDADIAKKLRKQSAWVSARKKVLTLDVDTQAALVAGKIDFNTALTALDIAPEDRKTVFENAATTKSGKVTAPALAAAARATGATTSKSLKRSEKEWNTWLKSAIDNTAAGPVQAFLFGIMDFKKGVIGTDELNALLSTLEGNEETASAAM